MSEDLVKRLRAIRLQSYGPVGLHALIGDAADEIERLQTAKRAALGIADERAKEAVDLRSQIATAMDMLGDVPGETLHDRLTRFIGWYMATQGRG